MMAKINKEKFAGFWLLQYFQNENNKNKNNLCRLPPAIQCNSRYDTFWLIISDFEIVEDEKTVHPKARRAHVTTWCQPKIFPRDLILICSTSHCIPAAMLISMLSLLYIHSPFAALAELCEWALTHRGDIFNWFYTVRAKRCSAFSWKRRMWPGNYGQAHRHTFTVGILSRCAHQSDFVEEAVPFNAHLSPVQLGYSRFSFGFSSIFHNRVLSAIDNPKIFLRLTSK